MEALAGIGFPRRGKSVVVFVGNAALKTEIPENVTAGFGEARRYIRSFSTRIRCFELRSRNFSMRTSCSR